MSKSIAERIAAQEKAALEKLVQDFGSQARLAEFLGVTPQAVNEWLKRGRISATAAAQLEEKTKGEYRKADLRPDVKEWFK
jgi:DNA-binding transcriptional regulator YdaS (Cro superfamily)